jgi:hypothetical protein
VDADDGNQGDHRGEAVNWKSIFFLCTVVCASGASGYAQAPSDSIAIVSVSPSGPVTRGVPQAFRIEVAVALRSADSAAIMVGFSTQAPDGWRMHVVRTVAAGSQTISLSVSAVPVDWGSEGQFSVRVAITPVGAGGSVLASGSRKIAVQP